jgi:hypothetical protein
VRIHDCGHDCQAQSCSPQIAVSRLIQPGKPLEDVRTPVGRNAGTVIFDLEYRLALVLTEFHTHLRAGVTCRVV